MRTYSGVVYPAHCDAMGHMNVQYYVAAFDQAMWHLVHALGYRPQWQQERDEGWADVQHNVNFAKELKVGTLFFVESRVGQVGTTSLTTVHDLYDVSGDLAASNEIKSVYFDLKLRKSLVLPNEIKLAAERQLASIQHAQSI
ncbi:acyl-CoA thioesterase [Rhizobium ruizarguesonis]